MCYEFWALEDKDSLFVRSKIPAHKQANAWSLSTALSSHSHSPCFFLCSAPMLGPIRRALFLATCHHCHHSQMTADSAESVVPEHRAPEALVQNLWAQNHVYNNIQMLPAFFTEWTCAVAVQMQWWLNKTAGASAWSRQWPQATPAATVPITAMHSAKKKRGGGPDSLKNDFGDAIKSLILFNLNVWLRSTNILYAEIGSLHKELFLNIN